MQNFFPKHFSNRKFHVLFLRQGPSGLENQGARTAMHSGEAYGAHTPLNLMRARVFKRAHLSACTAEVSRQQQKG